MLSLRRLLIVLAVFVVLLTVGGSWLLWLAVRSWNASGDMPVTIMVEASYRGANATVVAETVGAPIEQQINGVEGLTSMESTSGDDGSYSLTLTFAPRTDAMIAQVLVQNRVSLAYPMLPAVVHGAGVTVRRKSPAVSQLLVMTAGTDEAAPARHSAQIRGDLSMIPFVGDVSVFGISESAPAIVLDVRLLDQRGLTLSDVLSALTELQIQPDLEANHPAGGFSFKTKSGKFNGLDELANLVVKTDADGKTVRIRDIGGVELKSSDSGQFVRFDGRPAVALAIHATGPVANPRQFANDLEDKVAAIRTKLPAGMALDTPFEMAKSPPILVDLELPAGTSIQRIQDHVLVSGAAIRSIPGVAHTLSSTVDPFAAPQWRPCVLVETQNEKAAGGRDAIIAAIRTNLTNKFPDMSVRINNLTVAGSAIGNAYPVSFTVCDIGNRGTQALKELSDRIVDRLAKESSLTDAGIHPLHRPAPRLQWDIDRAKALALGISVDEIQRCLQCLGDGLEVGKVQQMGQAVPVNVRIVTTGRKMDALQSLKVRSLQGTSLPLSAVAITREVVGPPMVMRRDMYPAIDISASPAPGTQLSAARALCDQIAKEECASNFRVIWPVGSTR